MVMTSGVSAVPAVAQRQLSWRAVGADALWVGGAKIAGAAALVGSNFWVARHLPPGAYGVFAFASTCVLIVDGIVGSALDAVVLRYASVEAPTGPRRLIAVERAALVMKVAGAFVVLMAVTGFRRPLASWFLHGSEHAPVLVAAVAAGAGVVLLRSLQVHFQIAGRFARYGCVEVWHTGLRVVLILAALAGGVRSPAALIVAYAIAPLLIVLLSSHVLFWPTAFALWWQPEEWRRVAAFAVVALATCGVGVLVARLDLLVLGAAGEPAELGLFGIASTVAMIPMLGGAYLAPALSPRIVPSCRDGHFAALFATTQKMLLAAAVTMFVVIALTVPMLVNAVLPASYAAAIPVVRVLLVSGLAGFVTFPLTLHFLLFFSPRTYVAMDLASFPLLLPVYVYAAREYGALGVAWVSAAANATKAAIAQVRANHLLHRVNDAAATVAP
jgi:O-antigen/teichoic acid export membrane protein